MFIFSSVLVQEHLFVFLKKEKSDVSFLTRQMWWCSNSWLVQVRAKSISIKGSFSNSHPPWFHHLKRCWVHISTRTFWFSSLSCNRYVDIPLNAFHFCLKMCSLVWPITWLPRLPFERELLVFYEKVRGRKKKTAPHIWLVLATNNYIRQIGLENSRTRQQECGNARWSAKACNWKWVIRCKCLTVHTSLK